MTEPSPQSPAEPPARPVGLDLDGPLAPRSPWFFWRAAAAGGTSFWGLQLIAGWLVFQVPSAAAWALHLRAHAGFGPGQAGGSGLPTHWGEMLGARDLWELMENGGLKHDVLGTAAPVLATVGLLWLLWAGWRTQAEAAGVPGRLSPWLLGMLDGLLIGALPLALAGWPVLWALGRLADLGFSTLGWLNLAGGTVLRLALVSAVLLQGWFCRLERAATPRRTLLLGGWSAYGQHLRTAFLRLWLHPVQWGVLLVGGSALRLGLAFAALWAGWRLGGGSGARVWLFLLLQALATAAGAWLLGWFLRLAGLFWAQDRRVRRARAELEASSGEIHEAR